MKITIKELKQIIKEEASLLREGLSYPSGSWVVKAKKAGQPLMVVGGREDLSFALKNIFGPGYRILDSEIQGDSLHSKWIIVHSNNNPKQDPDLDVSIAGNRPGSPYGV